LIGTERVDGGNKKAKPGDDDGHDANRVRGSDWEKEQPGYREENGCPRQ
jgi:hypothetical protein